MFEHCLCIAVCSGSINISDSDSDSDLGEVILRLDLDLDSPEHGGCVRLAVHVLRVDDVPTHRLDRVVGVQVEDQLRVVGEDDEADAGLARVDLELTDEVPHEVEDALEVGLLDAARRVDGEHQVDLLVARCKHKHRFRREDWVLYRV